MLWIKNENDIVNIAYVSESVWKGKLLIFYKTKTQILYTYARIWCENKRK